MKIESQSANLLFCLDHGMVTASTAQVIKHIGVSSDIASGMIEKGCKVDLIVLQEAKGSTTI